MTIYLTAFLALLLLAQIALDLTVLLRLVLKKPAPHTSEEVEKAILDLGILLMVLCGFERFEKIPKFLKK